MIEGFKIIRSLEPRIVNGIKVTRHIVEYNQAITYMCEIELDGKIYEEYMIWQFMSDEDMIYRLQRKIMNETLGIGSSNI